MRVLFAFSTLLLLPGVAQAKPVCGPSTKSHTLASNGEARVYRSAARTFGCSRGHAPVALASGAKLAGHHAAAVSGSRLRVYNLSTRLNRAASSAGAKVHGFAVNADGVAAWIEDSAGGVRRVRTSKGGTLDTGAGIDKNLVHLASYAVSWRHGPYVRFGAYQYIEHEQLVPRLGRDLGTYDDVAFSVGSHELFARYRDGRRVSLYVQYDAVVGAGSGSGIDAARVNGTTIAVRTVYASNDAEIGAFDLIGGATWRRRCENAGAVADFVVSRSGGVACVQTGTANTVRAEDVTIDSGDASVGGLQLNGDTLSWRHGSQTLTAPLKGGSFHAVKEPCGPASAGTFARTATRRVYALHGTALACEAGAKRTVALGGAHPILDLELNGRYAAITRAVGDGAELRVRDVRTAHTVGRRVTKSLERFDRESFGTVVLSPDGLAVFATYASIADTAGTRYGPREEIQDSSLTVTGDVVSWIESSDPGGRDEQDFFRIQLRIQPVRHAHGLHLSQRDGTLAHLFDFVFALQGGQVVGRVGAGPFTALGAVTAEVLWPSGPATVSIATATGTTTHELPQS
jgi:hypothetical protein